MWAARVRVQSRIFTLGEKNRLEIDGGWGLGGGGVGCCSHRPEFFRGVWGHAPPPPHPPEKFCNFEPCESGSEVF